MNTSQLDTKNRKIVSGSHDPNMPLLVRQAAWGALKEQRGQSVRWDRLRVAHHLIGPDAEPTQLAQIIARNEQARIERIHAHAAKIKGGTHAIV